MTHSEKFLADSHLFQRKDKSSRIFFLAVFCPPFCSPLEALLLSSPGIVGWSQRGPLSKLGPTHPGFPQTQKKALFPFIFVHGSVVWKGEGKRKGPWSVKAKIYFRFSVFPQWFCSLQKSIKRWTFKFLLGLRRQMGFTGNRNFVNTHWKYLAASRNEWFFSFPANYDAQQ